MFYCIKRNVCDFTHYGMSRINKIIIILGIITTCHISIYAQMESFGQKALQEDFTQFREILEKEHCCLYEYISKAELDSLFDVHYRLIDDEMQGDEFFMLLAPITAKIGCMHTATWMPGRFFITKPTMMFPLTVRLIDEQLIVDGSYHTFDEVPRGSIILEINKKPTAEIIEQLREIISSDALNPYFIDAQIVKRFPLLYASVYGLPDQYEIEYFLPKKGKPGVKTLTPTDHETVRNVIYSKFKNPPLGFEIVEDRESAIMTVPTFIYYDKVDYFRNFMDSSFHLIKTMGIENLILDVRGNDGGDPFCASILLSFLQKNPVLYFAEPYGKYKTLSEPLPVPKDSYRGNLYILLDGSCASTNGHFCALLKYHKIGKFIGTPSGATYKCNCGKNTEFRLRNSQMIITIGRGTYSAAVKDMDKTAPIMPDIYVHESYDDFVEGRDMSLEKASEQIGIDR